MTSAVQIVKITKISSLFKKGTGEPATSIGLVNFSFENGDECGFNVVSQLGLYEVGDSAIYIQPDYCLPDTEMFSSFIAPNGDRNKTKLGKNGRIRAIKFNFYPENSANIVYSNGILLPITDGMIPESVEDLAEFWGITKYEQPEQFGNGDSKGNLPGFMYKTDEENAANLKSFINRLLLAGERLVCSLKIDGSSFSFFCRETEEGWVAGVTSRVLEKKGLDEPETTSDRWVHMCHSSGLYDKGMRYCKEKNRPLVFRGEMYGGAVTKGSGNKINPHSLMKPSLAIFGIDDLSSGFATRLLPSEVESICQELDLEYLSYTPIFPQDYDHLITIANDIFKVYKEDCGWVVEGIVVRTLDSNTLSCKVMNNAYDEKK